MGTVEKDWDSMVKILFPHGERSDDIPAGLQNVEGGSQAGDSLGTEILTDTHFHNPFVPKAAFSPFVPLFPLYLETLPPCEDTYIPPQITVRACCPCELHVAASCVSKWEEGGKCGTLAMSVCCRKSNGIVKTLKRHPGMILL